MHDMVLGECLNSTIGVAAYTALSYYDEENMDDAAALINEWTTEEGQCLLTHYFDETLHEVSEDMLWANHLKSGKLRYGISTFTTSFEAVD